MPSDEMVEKAQTLDDAIDNALIAWGMGWDMDGVMACLKEAKDRAALAAAEAGEPATGKGGLQVEEIRQAILDHCWGDSNGNVNGSILAAEAIATAIRARGAV